MEKIKPNLFLNYERQIGKLWNVSLNGETNFHPTKLTMPRVFFEALVPAAGSGQYSGKVLEAISNSIYIEARRHNMSLSSFGHLDPIKFVVAALYPFLIMGEVRRELGIACHYEFGNLQFGKQLSNLAGYDLDGTLANFTNYASRYNKLVARLNNLMIPEISLFKKWLKHRITIYKDDAGDRYSLYLYRMANIYELDVDASSSTAGQLLCRFADHKGQISFHNSRNLSDTLSYVETLLSRYEGDDDMVTFATEAIKAGIKSLKIEPIPSNSEAFSKVELPILYELDDIFSLENARFVYPITAKATMPSAPYDNLASWDIFEVGDKLNVGRIFDGDSDVSFYGRLPVCGFAPAGTLGLLDKNNKWSVSNAPIITHAKITSVPGLEALTRYMCSAVKYKDLKYAPGMESTVYVGHRRQTSTDVNNLVNKTYVLDTFNTEILIGCATFDPLQTDEDDYQLALLPVCFNYISEIPYYLSDNAVATDMDQILQYFYRTAGFKANMAVYTFAIGGDEDELSIMVPLMRDFDYVTSVTDDALQNFFTALAWNYSQLGSSSETNNEE